MVKSLNLYYILYLKLVTPNFDAYFLFCFTCRRIDKVLPGGRKCNENSTEPPCTGWVEMMAPAFSRAAWRCAWYMIQVRLSSPHYCNATIQHINILVNILS